MDSFAISVCYEGDVSEFGKALRVFTLVVRKGHFVFLIESLWREFSRTRFE
jgi:hypothetical protein